MQATKPVGGFFELELPTSIKSYHSGALALSTGRACLGLMLKNLNISKCYVPFYTCDALYDPFSLASVELEYYELNDQLEPLTEPTLKPDEYFLYINYFGVKSTAVDKLIKKYGKRLIIDNTHLFFHKGYKENWSFTSARKYFGVPDGAYLYSPIKITENLERFDAVSVTHNVLRLVGQQAEAYKEYEKYEKSLTSEINSISLISERLLSLIDYAEVEHRRKENFHFVHKEIGHLNEYSVDGNLDETPFAYPFLTKVTLDKREFYESNFFIPNLWLDPSRRDVKGFEFDKSLGERFLPLPIDHRYDTNDMKKITEKIKELL